MAVDIGKIIKFNARRSGKDKLPKITINALLNLPIIVRAWASFALQGNKKIRVIRVQQQIERNLTA